MATDSYFYKNTVIDSLIIKICKKKHTTTKTTTTTVEVTK